jgi:hypothetical protein
MSIEITFASNVSRDEMDLGPFASRLTQTWPLASPSIPTICDLVALLVESVFLPVCEKPHFSVPRPASSQKTVAEPTCSQQFTAYFDQSQDDGWCSKSLYCKRKREVLTSPTKWSQPEQQNHTRRGRQRLMGHKPLQMEFYK